MDFKLSNLNLTDVMNSWILQIGYPLITIERIDINSIRISQKNFLYDQTSRSTKLSPNNKY
jgi:aminopeptidase N